MDDTLTALLMTGNTLLTSVATALVTARKARSEARALEDKAFLDRYGELYKQMNGHLNEIKDELSEVKKEHEECNTRSLAQQAEINTLKNEVELLKIRSSSKGMR